MNVQSIVKNKAHVEIVCNNHDPIMILCSETCATTDILDSELNIAGYNLIRCDSHSRHTGGTLIYLKKSLKYVVIDSHNFDNNTWCLSIDVKSIFVKGIYTVIYHSPNTSHSVFMDILVQICHRCINLLKTCLIVGDFNIDMSKNNTYTDKLQSIAEQNSLKQIVNFYTRITLNTNTQIDLVLTNDKQIKCHPLIEDKISDHETKQISLNT